MDQKMPIYAKPLKTLESVARSPSFFSAVVEVLVLTRVGNKKVHFRCFFLSVFCWRDFSLLVLVTPTVAESEGITTIRTGQQTPASYT